MKNFKKVVAAGLALLMLALSVNVTFAAEEYTDKEAVVVAKVNAAGIMTGTDKGFEPSKTLTRAEAAAIFVRMKGISEATVKQNAGTTLFTDVAASHWAAGYVNVASNYGIIKGVGANKFAPEKEVTVAEFYTMAVRALNAGQLVESEGTWPTNYVNFAIENDLAEDVAQLYTAASTRMTAATIVANTLKAPMWNKAAYVNNGEITFTKGNATDTILKALNIKEFENVKFSGIDTKELTVNVDNTDIASASADVDVNERAGLGSAKEGIKYTLWYDTKEEEILGFWVPSNTDAIEFTDVKSDGTGTKVKLVVNGKEKEYDLATPSSDTYFELNRKEEKTGTPATTTWANLKKGDMPLFGVAYLNEEDEVEKVYAERFVSYGVVDNVTSARITFNKKDIVGYTNTTSTIQIDKDKDSDYQYFVTKDGKAIDVEDIEDGDVLFYYSKDKTYVIEVFEDTVEGKVSATNGQKVTIDGTKYDSLITASTDKIAAGDEGTFYLNQAGKIVMYELEEEAKGDYAIISEVRTRTSMYTDEKDLVEVKLATIDGEISDWMSVNAKKSDASWKSGDVIDATLLADGVIVQYEIKSDKVVLKETETDEFLGFEDAKIDYVLTKETNPTDVEKRYLSDSTKVFEINEYDDDKFKLVEVSADELDDDAAATGFIGDIDTDENEVGYVFFTSEVAKTEEANWAFILEASTDYDDGDEDSDIDSIYEVYFADKTTKTLYADSTEIVLKAGEVYELTIKDNEITKAKTDNLRTKTGETNVTYNTDLAKVAALDGLFVHEVKGNGLVTFIGTNSTTHKITSATTGYALSDNLIVVEKDDDDYKVTDFDSISKLSETDSNVVVDEDDYNDLVKAIAYTDDGETEIVVIIYNK